MSLLPQCLMMRNRYRGPERLSGDEVSTSISRRSLVPLVPFGSVARCMR